MYIFLFTYYWLIAGGISLPIIAVAFRFFSKESRTLFPSTKNTPLLEWCGYFLFTLGNIAFILTGLSKYGIEIGISDSILLFGSPTMVLGLVVISIYFMKYRPQE